MNVRLKVEWWAFQSIANNAENGALGFVGIGVRIHCRLCTNGRMMYARETDKIDGAVDVD